MRREEIRRLIRSYIIENFLFGYTDEDLKDNTSFMDIGVLDSTGIMELVAFIEREFEFSVLDNEITQKNLDSLELIVNYIEKKIAI